MAIPARVAERAATRADRADNGCFISRYSLGSHGRPQIGWWGDGQNHMTLAARAAWTHVQGPIPPAMTVDHIPGLCHDKRCVDTDHMRLLPLSENARRNQGSDYPLGQSCHRGHAPSERRPRSGGRGTRCRKCTRIADAAYRARRQAGV